MTPRYDKTFRFLDVISRVHCSMALLQLTERQYLYEVGRAAAALKDAFAEVDLLVAANLSRVLKAYSNARVGSHTLDANTPEKCQSLLTFLENRQWISLTNHMKIQKARLLVSRASCMDLIARDSLHFAGSTGYGHADAGGRDALDQAFAEIAGAEAACVRAQFFSGTHAIACALYGVLRPGDELIAVAGAPYDTMEEVIGIRGKAGQGSLRELGVSYREVQLAEDGGLDWDALSRSVTPSTRCALVQRSCGYDSSRKTLSMTDMERAVQSIKAQNADCVVVVDNCYGEFVDTREPTAVGADLIAGSLIKNPGGTIAPCGGYVAGKREWVEAAAARLCAPGIGMDAGATPGDTMRLLLQGLFLGPQMVGEAIKSSLLVAEVMSAKGFRVQPPPRVRRYDIIQAVELGSRDLLVAFCGAVQTRCPVGAYIKPVGGATAGYESEVVFADGTFIDGSTIELSCDGPLREPFAVFCQGGTHWSHWAIALDAALEACDVAERDSR